MQKQQKIALASIIIFLLGGLALAFYLAQQITRPTPKAAEDNIAFTLTAPDPDETTGETTLTIAASAPEGKAIRSLFAYINYGENIEALEINTPAKGLFSDPGWKYTKTANNKKKSQIRLSASYGKKNKNPSSEKLLTKDKGAPIFAAVKLKWLGEGPATLSLVNTGSTSGAYDSEGNFVAAQDVSLVLPSGQTEPTNTQEPTTIPTIPEEPPSIGIAPELSFKIAFQGVTPQTVEEERSTALPDPKQQTVRVKIVNPTLKINKTFEDVPVAYSQDDSTDAKAVYKGTLALEGVEPGDGYLVFIKGPRHLQKLFCQNKPIGPCRGRLSSQIAFVAGENEYDFSTLSLEAGDLPDPDADMAQDGVADARDWERLRALNAIPQEETTNQDLLVADLDLNGKIDLRDTGLLTDTLFKKYEEDEEAGFGIF